MLACSKQIITMFEDLGLSVEEIAEQQELNVVAVKAALLQGSRKYRELNNSHSSQDNLPADDAFTASEEQACRQVIYDLAVGSDDEKVRLRAARYIRDDKKGRLDKVDLGKLNINVVVFNEALAKARAAKERARQLASKPTKVIDV